MKRHAKILGVFTKTLKKLERLQNKCGKEAAKSGRKITKLENKIDTHMIKIEYSDMEAQAAYRSAKKIKEFIGLEDGNDSK